MQSKHISVKSSPRGGDCNGHTASKWLTPSLLGLHHYSTADLRSYLHIQLNQLCIISHQCHTDAPVLDLALCMCMPLACYRKCLKQQRSSSKTWRSAACLMVTASKPPICYYARNRSELVVHGALVAMELCMQRMWLQPHDGAALAKSAIATN